MRIAPNRVVTMLMMLMSPLVPCFGQPPPPVPPPPGLPIDSGIIVLIIIAIAFAFYKIRNNKKAHI